MTHGHGAAGSRRVLIALGGNAISSPDGLAAPGDQLAAVARAAAPIADVTASGADVVLTHGNGPQVGNLLVQNEMAVGAVPAVPLDWCGAQTQGAIGFLLINAVGEALAARGVGRPVASVVTRTRVDPADPGFATPTKPIGRYLPAVEAKLMIDLGQTWQDRGERGWRRVVASPQPLEIIDAPAVAALLDAGFVVVAAGGGGIPVTADPDGRLHGIEAVIDKDLSAALLGRAIGAQVLIIATDVAGAYVHFGTPDARRLGRIGVEELRRYEAAGHFSNGSMGPKVDAACRFVEAGGERAVITSLDHIADAVLRPDAAPIGTVVSRP